MLCVDTLHFAYLDPWVWGNYDYALSHIHFDDSRG